MAPTRQQAHGPSHANFRAHLRIPSETIIDSTAKASRRRHTTLVWFVYINIQRVWCRNDSQHLRAVCTVDNQRENGLRSLISETLIWLITALPTHQLSQSQYFGHLDYLARRRGSCAFIMRLLHAETLEFRMFDENSLPRYVILSHTWGKDEVSYQDMCWLQKLQNMPLELKSNPLYALFISAGGGTLLPSSTGAITDRFGYTKIAQTARITLKLGYQYFWIDTCCIDKTSSAELQEAINSMYRWYKLCSRCVVFLADAAPILPGTLLVDHFQGVLQNCRWITRGWTLQELVAPRYISFYDCNWAYICDKREVLTPLEYVTGIPAKVLHSGSFANESVAQKMSWAANRSTSRIEDTAYSLMGLFDIHMPMLYGEGERAFIRLQEEILKTSGDDSIFVWRAPDAGHSTLRGLLARSPSEFKKCAGVFRGNGSLPISKTNIGIHLQLNLRPFGTSKHSFVAMLQAANHQNQRFGIVLRKLDLDEKQNDDQQYTRVSARSLIVGDSTRDKYLTDKKVGVYVRQDPQLPRKFLSEYVYCFHLRDTPTVPLYHVRQAWPSEWWDATRNELIIPETQADFMAILWFEHQVDDQFTKPCPSFQLILGFSQTDCRGWAKIIPDQRNGWPAFSEPPGAWIGAINEHGPFKQCGRKDNLHLRLPYLPLVSKKVLDDLQVVAVGMQLVLRGDKLCYIVNVGFTTVPKAGSRTAESSVVTLST